MKGNGSKTGPRAIALAEREREALSMRRQGWDYRRISAALGISVSTAHRCVERALEGYVGEEADKLRALELSRLDSLQVEVTNVMAEADSDRTKLEAVDRLLRIMDRRAKYLGLDAPENLPRNDDVVIEVVLGFDSLPTTEIQAMERDVLGLPSAG